jgi:hypothetical protein
LQVSVASYTIPSVTEPEYFSALELRVCGELAGMRDKALQEIWCDGFLAEPQIEISRRHRRVTGKVWIGFGGSHQALWDFHLLLGAIVKDPQQIDWSALLPANEVTGWLSMYFESKLLVLRPYAAYPDIAPAKGSRSSSSGGAK